MSVLPSVRAALEERFIFNFRMPPERLAAFLPAPWLEPQPIRGCGVVSFCLLDLRNITVAPLPPLAGLTSLSCAPRYAVLDRSRHEPEPAVFVTERQTDSAFGAWFTGLGFSAPHSLVDVDLRREGGWIRMRVGDPKKGTLFSASVRQAPESGSLLFRTTGEFGEFIARGVTSYGLSRHPGRLTKVDLHKQDGTYEPLAAVDVAGPVAEPWLDAGGALDSVFRTAGGRYEWVYKGLVDASTGRPA